MLGLGALPVPGCGEGSVVLDLGEVELDLLVLVVDVLHDLLYFMQAIVRDRRNRSLLLPELPRTITRLCKQYLYFSAGGGVIYDLEGEAFLVFLFDGRLAEIVVMVCKSRQRHDFILELQRIEGIYADTVLLFLVFGRVVAVVLFFCGKPGFLVGSGHKRCGEQR